MGREERDRYQHGRPSNAEPTASAKVDRERAEGGLKRERRKTKQRGVVSKAQKRVETRLRKRRDRPNETKGSHSCRFPTSRKRSSTKKTGQLLCPSVFLCLVARGDAPTGLLKVQNKHDHKDGQPGALFLLAHRRGAQAGPAREQDSQINISRRDLEDLQEGRASRLIEKTGESKAGERRRVGREEESGHRAVVREEVASRTANEKRRRKRTPAQRQAQEETEQSFSLLVMLKC